MDRMFANEAPLATWEEQATLIRNGATDVVIENAVMQLPAEVRAISSARIIAMLKSRRDQLPAYAAAYYKFLAEEVEVKGTEERDLFEVTRVNDETTTVRVYRISGSGKVKGEPFYSRDFNTDETREIRLYGIAGQDVYHINGNTARGIRIRIIGGIDKD